MSARTTIACVATAFFLSACAWATRNVYRDSQSPDAGSIEFVNVYPQYRVSITVFREAEECRGTKFVSMFEVMSRKTVKEDHKDKLSIYLGVSVQADLQVVSGCGGIFTVPFQSGDLRATFGYFPNEKQCRFLLESLSGSEGWKPIQNVARRKAVQPMWQDGSFCSP